MSDPKNFRLNNQLSLILMPMSGIETATVMLMVGAGSRQETRRINGLAHMLEHMAFKGTKKRPTAQMISSEIDAVGGEHNAFTDKEITAYYIKLPSKYIEIGLDILSDMVSNSLYKEEEIEKEKGVVIQEIKMYEDTPMLRVQDDFLRLLYGDSPMGWEITGTEESVRRLKRRDFLAYIRRCYRPEKMVLGLAGKIDGKTKGLAEKYFHQLKPSSEMREVERHLTDGRSSSKEWGDGARLKLHYKKTEQAHFCLGVPGFSLKHRGRYSMAVLAAILGGGMSSRLFLEIRERRGLAYYIYSEPNFFTDSGYLVNRAGVKLEKIEEAVRIIIEQMEDLASKRIREKELFKGKEWLKGHLLLSLEDSKNVATEYLSSFLLEGKIRPIGKVLQKIDEVTADDCRRTAAQLFTRKKINLAVIGPYKDEKAFLGIIK